jgi:hypothetical protein
MAKASAQLREHDPDCLDAETADHDHRDHQAQKTDESDRGEIG